MAVETAIIIPVVTAITGLIAGWIAKRPTKVEQDVASWKRMNDFITTLQEEMLVSKAERTKLHYDLDIAMARGVHLREELLTTKLELIEVKALLHEAIIRLKKNEINIQGLEFSKDETRKSGT